MSFSKLRSMITLATSLMGLLAMPALAFDPSSQSNLAVYWGQNSYGATHTDSAGQQKTLSYYCNDDTIDVIPMAFLDVFFDTGNLPSLNFANICSTVTGVFDGTQLPNCSSLAADIKTCQSKGKIVTLSMGGATGANTFSDEQTAKDFADQIWNLFLGGSSDTRPFGDAVLDGVDLDIEGGSAANYPAFVTQLRSHTDGADKSYYVTGAPQCPFPDAYLGSVINAVGFDAIYVQLYNNYCGVSNYGSGQFNFADWDNWAKNTSPNKDVKIYIGAPASSTAANSGYVDASTLGTIIQDTKSKYSSFGGAMLWDASQAYANDRYDQTVKGYLGSSGSGSGSSSSSSVASSITKSQTSSTSTSQSATSSGASSPTASTTKVSSTTTSAPATSSTASSGNCGSAAAWDSGVPYTGGQQVTYNGHLWTAKWWTQNETPGGSSGVWIDDGACSTRRSRFFKYD